MNFAYPIRTKLTVLLLVTILLTANIRQLLETLRGGYPVTGNDEISLYEKRFDGLRKILPPHGVVTYLDDSKSGRDDFKAYYLAQYALSPIVLLDPKFATTFYSKQMLVQNRKFIIENVHDPIREPYLTRLLPGQFAAAKSHESVGTGKASGDGHSVLLKDFGNGVSLYQDGMK